MRTTVAVIDCGNDGCDGKHIEITVSNGQLLSMFVLEPEDAEHLSKTLANAVIEACKTDVHALTKN